MNLNSKVNMHRHKQLSPSAGENCYQVSSDWPADTEVWHEMLHPGEMLLVGFMAAYQGVFPVAQYTYKRLDFRFSYS